MPSPLLLATEKGYNTIPGIIAQDITSWADVKQVARELRKAEVKAAFKSIIVDTVERILAERDQLAKESDAQNIFYASDLSENFINMIEHIFRGETEDAKVKFKNFDLEKGE